MAANLQSTLLFRSPLVDVIDWRCRPTNGACGPEEHSDASSVAIPRRGVFVKHQCGAELVGDANAVMFFNRHEPYRVSHPVAGGDDCTSFRFAPHVLADALRMFDPSARHETDGPFAHSHGPLSSPTLHLCQRLRQQLLEGTGDPLLVEEVALRFLARALHESHAIRGQRPPRPRADTERAHREWAESARVVLNRRLADRVLLGDVAREVHCSPFHLARVFRRHIGIPIHRYLNRLRLRSALDRLLDESSDLTTLALDLGFASHAHFSTAFRREFGSRPSSLRQPLDGERVREMSKNLEAGRPPSAYC
jgi:AraC-like DNA-binding protein